MAQGSHELKVFILGNIPKYFHKKEADLEEINWLNDLSYSWEYKIQLILLL